ncbi:MAG: DNA primase [Clostridiales bacterium]|nr:DNA primase [Clostridiales bacterium]
MGAVSRENIVEEIKSRCNIVDVIGQAVPLKKAGSHFKGLCPFHNEKTPSFVVSEPRQAYYCFGCNASGDVLTFMQQYYNLDFKEAIDKLAAQYGIEIVESNFGPSNKDELYEVNRKAARFFYESFQAPGNPGLAYMQGRGVEPGILKKFGIGYADAEWDSLVSHFAQAGTDISLLISVGLATESKGKCYDKFRDRVIFPIINTSGKVIGFGGRALGDAEPKYLNSPETAVFLKKNNLFGLNLTRQDIGKENRAILVEGYMDVISLYQHGVRNVSATLGTALTENQAKLLKRYTPNVVLSYDADAAGQAAALRGIDVLRGEGLKVKVLTVPSGKDPDDFVKQHGKQEFLELASKAPSYADYKIGVIQKKHDMSQPEGKVDFIKEAVGFLKTLSPVEAETYIKVISKNTKISESAITLEYNDREKGQTRKFENPQSAKSAYGKDRPPDVLERNLVKLAVSSRGYYDKIKPLRHAFASKQGQEIFGMIDSCYADRGEADTRTIADSLGEECAAVLADIMENVFFAGKEDQVFADCIRKIQHNDLLDKEKEIVLKLSMADEVDNVKQIEALTRELLEVQREIQKKKN